MKRIHQCQQITFKSGSIQWIVSIPFWTYSPGQKDEPTHHNQDQPTSNAFGNDLERNHVSARVLVRSDEGKEWKPGEVDRPFPFLNLPPIRRNAKLVCGCHHPSCSSGWDYEICVILLWSSHVRYSWADGVVRNVLPHHALRKAKELKKPFV